jgi:hypothetical protein
MAKETLPKKEEQIDVVKIPLATEEKIRLANGEILNQTQAIALALNKLERIEKAVC